MLYSPYPPSPSPPMKKIYYHKLIRDKIPERIAENGSRCSCYSLDKKAFEQELLKKVGEEASALPKVVSRKELIDELADVYDVLDEIRRLKRITPAEIRAFQKIHQAKKGGF